MDKIKGEGEERGGFSWGGVEGWGEKAHNCKWLTIKITIKKNKSDTHKKRKVENVNKWINK